mgnify:CR=1 FL=1
MSSPRPVSTDSSRTNAVAPAGTSAPAAERNAAPTLNERLENLPFTRAHGKLLGISGLGWALDAMDVGLISFVMAALIKEWQLSPTEASWLGSIGFAGMALGATFGGLLADKLGRRYIFAPGNLPGCAARLPFPGWSGSGRGTSRGVHPDF